jgi:hypothetical protein
VNTFDENTGVFHYENPPTDFTIEMADNTPGSETFQLRSDFPVPSTWPKDENELLHWLGRFFGTNNEAQFRHIIDRVRMDYRQDENTDPQRGSFM